MIFAILAALFIAVPIGEEFQTQYMADRQTEKGKACYAKALTESREPSSIARMLEERQRFYACYER